jgi:acyl-CoA reductase-like NAD-dependent aldehyde dehydrogenase
MPGQTALVGNLMSRIIAEVKSLPAGVVNIFTESGNTGAPYLVASPDVQVVSYTGSIAVGRIVAATGAPTLKRMNLELGGKTPMIVFDDADLDTAVPLLAAAVTTFTGQFRMAGSRILVQRGVADEVRARLVRILENVRLGDGLDPSTEMGPLITKADVARVDGMVEAALAYAKPVVRGGPATEGGLAAGAFYRPALRV